VDGFRTAAGAGQVLAGEDQVGDRAAGFLHRLAADDVLRRLARIDDAGHRLDDPRSLGGLQPRRLPGGEGAHAELFDQHQGVALRVVEHGADGVAALEHLAAERLRPAAGEQPVAQGVTVDAEIALEGRKFLDDLDVNFGFHMSNSSI